MLARGQDLVREERVRDEMHAEGSQFADEMIAMHLPTAFHKRDGIALEFGCHAEDGEAFVNRQWIFMISNDCLH